MIKHSRTDKTAAVGGKGRGTMGNAHSLVINKTHKKICVITFNLSDMLYTCTGPPSPTSYRRPLCP